MTEVPERRESRRRTKVAAIVLILLLEIGAIIYLSGFSSAAPKGPTFTYTFPTTTTSKTTTSKTTTSTAPPANLVSINSALIFNDTLSMNITNLGTHWTKSISIIGICTPDLKDCYNYQTLSGRSTSKIFALAPKAEFVENITGVCGVPVQGCRAYQPVANFTYYYAVRFTFESGNPVILPVVAKANNTYPPKSTIQGLSYQLNVSLRNSNGTLALNLLINDSTSAGNFSMTMLTRTGKRNMFRLPLLTNRTGCGGSMDVDCSSGNVTMLTGFSTVETGIGTPFFLPPYMLTAHALNGSVNRNLNFAIWVPVVNGTGPPGP